MTTDYSRLKDWGYAIERDPEFEEFVRQMPEKHWAKHDLSAVRLGWEAGKVRLRDLASRLPEQSVRTED